MAYKKHIEAICPECKGINTIYELHFDFIDGEIFENGTDDFKCEHCGCLLQVANVFIQAELKAKEHIEWQKAGEGE